MTDLEWSGGLAPEREFFFAERPADPEMRESTSIWMFDDQGRFAFPRIGIEAQGREWGHHRFDANFAFADGRVLKESTRAETQSAIGPDGRPTILGVGPLQFEMVEPFRTWLVRYEGDVSDFHVRDMIAGEIDMSTRVPVKLEAELTMANPCWVQDNSPDKLASMTPGERADAESMGIGWRLEHNFRAVGQFTVDGVTHDFSGTGNRIKRQSLRPLMNFRGHCWQSCVFPDGTAFGHITYPSDDEGNETYNEGYVFVDGRMHKARSRKQPWLRRLLERGDDASVEMAYDGGVLQIGGTTELCTFKVRNPDLGAAFDLQQTAVRYTLGEQSAFGMMERSAFSELVEQPG